MNRAEGLDSVRCQSGSAGPTAQLLSLGRQAARRYRAPSACTRPRDAVLAFMAAQGEADYRNRAEMQRRGVAIAKAAGKYTGRIRTHAYAAIKAWRAENGASIRDIAEKFGVGTATAKRACAEGASVGRHN